MMGFSPPPPRTGASILTDTEKPVQNWGGGGPHFQRWRLICTALMSRCLTHAGLKAPPDHTGRRLPLGEKKKKAPPVGSSRKTSAVRRRGGDGRMRGGRERSGDGEKPLPVEGNVRCLSTLWRSPPAPNQSCWLRVRHGRK